MLNKVQYANLSNHLKAEEAAVRAVVEVESKGNGFLPNGKPKILFGGHVFWRELKKAGIDPARHVKGNGDILYQNGKEYKKNNYDTQLRKHYEKFNGLPREAEKEKVLPLVLP